VRLAPNRGKRMTGMQERKEDLKKRLVPCCEGT
jgi:hypothetical protein